MKYREVENGSWAGPWKIRLFGRFSLIDAGGRSIDFRNQKCEGLVAIVALHRPHGIEREVAARSLWPEKPLLKRQENLRQTIAIIRHHAGVEFLFTNRTHCGLSEQVELECDYDQPQLRSGPIFMPGQTSPWFEQVRLDMAVNAETNDQISMMNHCLEFLRWSARCDPKGFYAFFRTNRYLVRGLPLNEMSAILDSAGRPEGACGWADYWRGAVEDNLDLSARYLRRALAGAIGEPDWDLASAVCFELGKVYACLGEVDRAHRMARAADEVAERSNEKSARIDAARLKGTLLLHWGEGVKGLGMLRQSADEIDDPVRRMVAESTQALFEAMAGQFVSAGYSLEIGERLARETGHEQAGLLNSLTRGLLSAHDGPRINALPLLETTAFRSYQSGSRQLGVYAEEVSARLLLLDNEGPAAHAKLGSAKHNRLQAHMACTPLERKMVTAVR